MGTVSSGVHPFVGRSFVPSPSNSSGIGLGDWELERSSALAAARTKKQYYLFNEISRSFLTSSIVGSVTNLDETSLTTAWTSSANDSVERIIVSG